MNVKGFLFYTLFFLSLVTFSQGVEFGLIAGSNYSTMGGDTKNMDGKIDFHAGLFLNRNAIPNINYNLEVVYSRQGASASDVDLTLLYNYINTSVLVKYLVTSSLHIFVGPQLGIRVNGKVDDGNKKEDVTEDLGTANFAVVSGIGYYLTSNVHIIGRYNHGFSSNTSDILTNQKFPFRVAQLSIGYTL